MNLLPWEIASVRVTGLSRDTFNMGNIYGYVKKSKETAQLGFSIPKQNNHQVSSKWNRTKNGFFNDMADFMAKFWTGLLK